MTTSIPTKYAIPEALNVAILSSAMLAACFCLYQAAHTSSLLASTAAAIGFGFVNNTIFSLLHESVHGIFHSNKRINNWAGVVASTFFPTSYSLQKAFHLNHHRNNRSAFEQFDYLRPGDNRFVKYAQWYSILTGLYWAFPPLFCLLYAITPRLFRLKMFAANGSTIAYQTSASAYLGCLESANLARIRLEVALTVMVQATLFVVLDLSFAAWIACYTCFAVGWSSLQYADHAFSPLDRNNGAWNLTVHPVVKWAFLNYHYHLNHHRFPNLPWIYLARLPGTPAQTRSFLRIYWSMWGGPRPITTAVRSDDTSSHEQTETV